MTNSIRKLIEDLRPGLERLTNWAREAEERSTEDDLFWNDPAPVHGHPVTFAREIGVKPLPTKVWVVTQLYGLMSGDHSAPVAVFTSEALAREYMGRQRDNRYLCAYEIIVNAGDEDDRKEFTFFNGQEIELN